MEVIKWEGRILSIIYREGDWVDGLNFITPNELFIQVGSWQYQKGKKLTPHKHIPNPRTAEFTQEMTFVKRGSMRVDLFDEEGVFIRDFVLYEGDLAVLAGGGHGYEILENGTQILEAKNGPFTSLDQDKERFE